MSSLLRELGLHVLDQVGIAVEVGQDLFPVTSEPGLLRVDRLGDLALVDPIEQVLH